MAVNDKRSDYFEAPHYLSASKNSYPSAQHTGNPPVDVGSDNYNSEADRITEQELVPDIVERLSLRYGINYGKNHNIPEQPSNTESVELMHLIKLLGTFIPGVLDGKINKYNSYIVHITANNGGSNILEFKLPDNTSSIVNMYLASSMIDLQNTGSGAKYDLKTKTYKITTTIPFRNDDDLIIIYKKK